MALEEYLGAIVMEIDGQEIEVTSVDVRHITGRKLVKTMNRTGRAKGFAKGIETYDLTVSAVIPTSGDIDWAAIEGAKITIYPLETGGQRTSYLDVFTLDVGDKYQVDNEAMRDLTMAALREVKE
jgi:hypothetical protein